VNAEFPYGGLEHKSTRHPVVLFFLPFTLRISSQSSLPHTLRGGLARQFPWQYGGAFSSLLFCVFFGTDALPAPMPDIAFAEVPPLPNNMRRLFVFFFFFFAGNYPAPAAPPYGDRAARLLRGTTIRNFPPLCPSTIPDFRSSQQFFSTPIVVNAHTFLFPGGHLVMGLPLFFWE